MRSGSRGPRSRQRIDRQSAAVMVPVFRDPGAALRLVVVRRTEGGPHGGQLAFPGGRVDPADLSPWRAALREANEEIGLEPAAVELLAALPLADTLTTRFRIFPFLARVSPPAAWRLQPDEIAEVLEPRLDRLLDPQAHARERVPLPGGRSFGPTPCCRIGRHRLWGVSYRILQPLLPRLAAREWPL